MARVIDIIILIGIAIGVLWLLAIQEAKREINEDHCRHIEDNQE